MQGKLNKNREKFLPLRRFSYPDLYNEFYLSNLVQRKKLKARKIGRNYYTTITWFKEYLTLHARDKKRQEYYKFLENLDKNIIEERKPVIDSRSTEKTGRLSKVGFFNWSSYKGFSFSSFWLGFCIALVIILSSMSIFNNNLKNSEQPGQVAGVEEVGSSTDMTIEAGE